MLEQWEMNMKMLKAALIAFGLVVGAGAASGAGHFDTGKLHDQFTQAFSARDWAGLKALLADDIVFHRASGEDVYIGPDAVIERFSSTIGAPDKWNVKFAALDSDSQFEGNDGRVVERGDFAVTAGGDSGSCYRGSYMMTWAKQADAGWRLQLLAWQDVETKLENCK